MTGRLSMCIYGSDCNTINCLFGGNTYPHKHTFDEEELKKEEKEEKKELIVTEEQVPVEKKDLLSEISSDVLKIIGSFSGQVIGHLCKRFHHIFPTVFNYIDYTVNGIGSYVPHLISGNYACDVFDRTNVLLLDSKSTPLIEDIWNLNTSVIGMVAKCADKKERKTFNSEELVTQMSRFDGVKKIHYKFMILTCKALQIPREEITLEECFLTSRCRLANLNSKVKRIRLINTKLAGVLDLPRRLETFVCRGTQYTEKTLISICLCYALNELEIDATRILYDYLLLFPESLVLINIHVERKYLKRCIGSMKRLGLHSIDSTGQTIMYKMKNTVINIHF